VFASLKISYLAVHLLFITTQFAVQHLSVHPNSPGLPLFPSNIRPVEDFEAADWLRHSSTQLISMAEIEKGGEPTGSLGEKPSVEQERRKSNVVDIFEGHEVNASGHEDELQRQYGIWSLCGLALTIDNAWVALGGSIIVASGKVTQLPPAPALR
jgi:hypothetical protein